MTKWKLSGSVNKILELTVCFTKRNCAHNNNHCVVVFSLSLTYYIMFPWLMGMVVGSLCSCPVSLPSRAHCETLDWTLEHRLGHWSLWSMVGMAGKKFFQKHTGGDLWRLKILEPTLVQQNSWKLLFVSILPFLKFFKIINIENLFVF